MPKWQGRILKHFQLPRYQPWVKVKDIVTFTFFHFLIATEMAKVINKPLDNPMSTFDAGERVMFSFSSNILITIMFTEHFQAGEGGGGGREHPGEQCRDHGKPSLKSHFSKNCIFVYFLSFKKVIKQLLQHSDSEVQDTMDVSVFLFYKFFQSQI